ncbi:MAG: GNAT family N-acetyltransferase [Candidatus Heimdallarchaeaceae archaeon]
MTIEYCILKKHEDFSDVVDIQRDAWGMPDLELVPRRLIYATTKSGGITIGAFDKDKLIGYCWGWIGKNRKQGTFIYSHHNAVRKKYQGKGIGAELKRQQRKWAIYHNFKTIYWTFDPLQSRNSYLNLHKLGAIVKTYFPNHWGAMHDALNIGIETDRFYAEWHLLSTRVQKYLNNEFEHYEECLENENNKVLKVKEEEFLQPQDINLDIEESIILVRIPHNIDDYPLNLKKEWRIKTRAIFQHYFAKGYVVADFVLDKAKDPMHCYHILKKQ